MMSKYRISPLYILSIIVAVAFTWLLHEFAHWAASEWMGYDTTMTLNGTYPKSGTYDRAIWHYLAVSLAGPLVTVVQALAVFGHLKFRGWVKIFYPFLFVPAYMRLLAGVMNVVHPNDEGRVSLYLGLGRFTLPILVSILLFGMLYAISRQHHVSWKFQFYTFLIVILVSSAWILLDQFYHITII